MCHCICIQHTYSDKSITIYKITKETWKISIFMVIKNKKDYTLYVVLWDGHRIRVMYIVFT